MKSKKLIVFDMDGVLIDVAGSYRDTVRQTARLFFRGACSWQDLPDPLLSLSDLGAVKQSSGENNDWDFTCLVINLLFSLVPRPGPAGGTDDWVRHEKTVSACDVATLARFLRSQDQPLTALLKEKGPGKDNLVMTFYEGDVGSGNIIKQIFQEVYLGKDRFESTYGVAARVYRDEGYMNREKLLIPESLLQELARDNVLAIATGRPEAEAEYALDFFGLRKHFKDVRALEDCLKEEERILRERGEKVSLRKPHPYMLDAIAADNDDEVSGFCYIGDMPDDMVAAGRARTPFVAVGVLFTAPDKASLERDLSRAGADHVVANVEELKAIIEAGQE